MKASQIIILRDTVLKPTQTSDSECMTFQDLRHLVLNGQVWKLLFRYRNAKLLTYRIELLNKPFNTALLLRALCYGECVLEDELGRREEVTLSYIVKLLCRLVKDALDRRTLLRQIQNEKIHETYDGAGPASTQMDLQQRPLYLRTDLVFGVRSGGSVGHIAGVLNNLSLFCGKPIFFSTDNIPTVDPSIETHVISPSGRFRDFYELPSLYLNEEFIASIGRLVEPCTTAFVYQRYSLNNYSGLTIASAHKVPFVLEYNGSEVWISRHWGKPLLYEHVSEQIELLNLRAAQVIVVVSKAMRDEIVHRGIDGVKILVNPNGVDPEKYSPSVDGTEVRTRFNLKDKVVLGFIGTFGRWHGAEVLAEAVGRLLQEYPEYRKTIRLLMIGDGQLMSEVKRRLAEFKVGEVCILTGLVPQEQGPMYLAACDILVSPHVPNPDGTPFFGSPTKLFEYMAMGKGIVASNLDQIGEVLLHDQTAWLVTPGDPHALAQGLKVLLDDPIRCNRLGDAARKEVVSRYTWRAHTRNIIEKLKEQCG